jgi:hypothetical protein
MNGLFDHGRLIAWAALQWGPGVRTPTFWQCRGPSARGPSLFGFIHKMFYFRELNATSLMSSQLAVFSYHDKYTTLQQLQAIMQNMMPEVRCLFPQVERLIRYVQQLCVSERSFRALRRLKTWLNCTMTQPWPSAVAVCQVHKDILTSDNWQKNLQIGQTFVGQYLETGYKQKLN